MGDETTDIAVVLLEAMRWAGSLCTNGPQAEEVAKCMRSEELASAAALVFPKKSGSYLGTSKVTLATFATTRKSMIVSRGMGLAIQTFDVIEELNRPRSLLLFRPAMSLFDGAAVPVSDGFLDEEYFPPWDSWLTIVPCNDNRDLGLLSWVPKWASSRVNDSILADPGECLCWVRMTGGVLEEWTWGQPWPEAG